MKPVLKNARMCQFETEQNGINLQATKEMLTDILKRLLLQNAPHKTGSTTLALLLQENHFGFLLTERHVSYKLSNPRPSLPFVTFVPPNKQKIVQISNFNHGTWSSSHRSMLTWTPLLL